MEQAKAAGDGGGCGGVAIGLVLGFAALQGGIVVIATSLHRVLTQAFTPAAALGVAGGVVLAFLAPRILLAGARSSPRVTWRQAIAALPDFYIAGWFILGWAAPQAIGREAAGMLVGAMVLEFIIIHASVMLVALPEEARKKANEGIWWKTPAAATAGLVLLYSLFAAAISASFKTVWLFLGFWMLLGNKFIGDWLSPAGDRESRKQEHMARWSTSALLYLLLAFGSVFIPVPRLGARSASDGDGLWERNPEQAVAMGAMYFALLGFLELYGAFRKRG